jgi:serine phosphatase RsbU (regulator of sigma subunit)
MLGNLHTTQSATIEAGALSRVRRRLSRVHSFDEACAQLASITAGLFRRGTRCELFVRRGGELVPSMRHEPAERRAGRTLLASLRTRLLATGRALSEPQALAAYETAARRPVMSAPVLDASEELAALLVVEGTPDQAEFDRMELVALEAISTMLSSALPPAAAERAQARKENDRRTARQLQRGFMSSALPSDAGVTACAEYLPAFDVGGDFYSVTYLGDRSVNVTIGDVSGNGVPAALLMSRVTAEIEQAVSSGASPADVLSSVHTRLSGRAGDMFVTAACVHIDARRRWLTMANAGHVPLVVRRASGDVLTFGGPSGTPLGMLSCDYAQDDLALEKGDIILLVTDGLLEALDHPTGHRGLELLIDQVHAAGHDPTAIGDHLRSIVHQVRKEHALDDVTWLALQLVA